jgi:cytochrome P450
LTITLAVLDVFGPNLSTVEGRDWQRHRKATSPPFGEPNMPLVWTSCISQAHEMLSYWASLPSNFQTGKDVRRFSLHVLTATGFGKPYHFDRFVDEALPKDGSLSYKDSLSLILENCILIMLLGPKLLTGKLQRFLPKQWRLVGKATNTFKTHIASSIKEEKALVAAGKSNSGNFINAMVRASEEEAKSSTTGAQKGLSETEIFGNIFVFNFAGHDSIAITLTYVITHLAANPEVQDWIAEEINHVFRHKGYTSYKDAFSRLKRCTAVVVSLLLYLFPSHMKVFGGRYVGLPGAVYFFFMSIGTPLASSGCMSILLSLLERGEPGVRV